MTNRWLPTFFPIFEASLGALVLLSLSGPLANVFLSLWSQIFIISMWISAWGTEKSLHLLDAVSGVVVAGLYCPFLLDNPKLRVMCVLGHSQGGASFTLPSMIWAFSSL
jgi:hypothetical protein